jgi:hypothetical protein
MLLVYRCFHKYDLAVFLCMYGCLCFDPYRFIMIDVGLIISNYVDFGNKICF